MSGVPDELDLTSRVLDLQIVDCDGFRCGRVDDIELAGDPPRVEALLTGTGSFPDRLPSGRLQRVARRLIGPAVLGGNVARIPWSEVDEVDERVVLRRKAAEMELGRGDRDLATVIGKLPGT